MTTLFIELHPESLDNNAWFITIVGYCVVVLMLLILVVIFNNVHRVQDYLAGRRRAINDPLEEKPAATSGDVNAAISTALFLYFSEMHDEERYVMTVKKVSKTYSPWNSKIYGIMNKIKYW